MTKTALITGASRGLGAALADRFWSEGYSLILVARDVCRLQRIAAGLRPAEWQTCDILSCDLGQPAEVDRLVSRVVERYRALHVLVNNAAIHGPIGPLSELDLHAWRNAVEVNLMAPVTLCRGFIPLMQTDGGSIVNISGGGATAPRPRFTAYATSKAALVRFSETLAEETKSIRIRVNCIAPGPMKTRLLAEIVHNPQMSGEKEVSMANAAERDIENAFERVGRLALFLASDASRHISGKLISARWDRWEAWSEHAAELASSDVYTLRRIVGRDRDMTWGDQ
jgi:NAD(P)-dependent dehydrogenase (short-subunit alcohol dehydrogenase family)